VLPNIDSTAPFVCKWYITFVNYSCALKAHQNFCKFSKYKVFGVLAVPGRLKTISSKMHDTQHNINLRVTATREDPRFRAALSTEHAVLHFFPNFPDSEDDEGPETQHQTRLTLFVN
jgi:hypothetical protein